MQATFLLALFSIPAAFSAPVPGIGGAIANGAAFGAAFGAATAGVAFAFNKHQQKVIEKERQEDAKKIKEMQDAQLSHIVKGDKSNNNGAIITSSTN